MKNNLEICKNYGNLSFDRSGENVRVFVAIIVGRSVTPSL